MAIEIMDLPIKNGGSFHSYVSLPEGTVDTRFFALPKFPNEAHSANHCLADVLDG